MGKKQKILLVTIIIILFTLQYNPSFVFGEIHNKLGLSADGIKSVNTLYENNIITRQVDNKIMTQEYMQELYYVMTLLSYDNMGIQVRGRELNMMVPPKQVRDKAIKEAEDITGLVRGETDRETVKNIDKYLRGRVDYVDGAPNAHHSYGALIDGKAVCEGYARAFKLMCDTMGIPSLVIVGEADFGLAPRKLFGADLVVGGLNLNHAWNIVYVEGEWYHFDTTWNDNLGESRYTFLTEKEIRKDHNFETKYLDEIIALTYGEEVKTYSGKEIDTKGYEIRDKKGFSFTSIRSVSDIPTWFWLILSGVLLNILIFIRRMM